jgi:hypothetical protein
LGYLLSGILLIKAAVSGILLAVSTLWAAQLGMPLAVEELGMYLFLTIAGAAGVFFYMRHLHAAPVVTQGSAEPLSAKPSVTAAAS